jgi:hypothetical protein
MVACDASPSARPKTRRQSSNQARTMKAFPVCSKLAAVLAVLAARSSLATAQTQLRESFTSGHAYQVSSRVELGGTLTLPPEKGHSAGRNLSIAGKSAIEYEERILAATDGKVQKTARLYQRMDFERKVAGQHELSALRPAVRRLVILRRQNVEVPFSPDGPLTWHEIDLIRTDVFTPALAGLFPDRAVQPGARWQATRTAILELTDMERLDEGGLLCQLRELTTVGGRQVARVDFRGSVRGPGEDGPTRHELDGYLFFDIAGQYLSYLSMRGVQSLLERDGKVAGKIEGNFVLTRRPVQVSAALGDAALRDVSLEPTAENTLLLYDNTELGLRFLYPRRWRVAGVHGRQVAVDDGRGNGLLITVEPPARLPTGEQYLQESRAYLLMQKATILRIEPVQVVRKGLPAVEQFGLELQLNGQRARMEYSVVRDAAGGAAIAARLLPADLAVVQPELRQIVQSMRVTRTPR